jgi:transketolase
MIVIQNTGSKDTRSGFGEGLLEAARQNPKVVGLCADLTGSLKMDAFAKAYPERFFQCGVAEANMIGVAAGLSVGGFIPFASTFANFATGRVYDQIRQSVCYSNQNVKICASHAGLTLGEDGATHQILEDIGLMKMLPNMTVIAPCDYNQTRLATLRLVEHTGPAYLRFGRPKVPNFTPVEDPNFKIGKIQRLRQGSDVTILACGHLVWSGCIAAQELSQEGIECEVINVHTIKPLDEAAILEAVSLTRRVVTAEEHMRNGGLGDSIAQLLAGKMPLPIEMVAVNDTFGESGTPESLMAKYGIDIKDIKTAVRKVLSRT